MTSKKLSCFVVAGIALACGGAGGWCLYHSWRDMPLRIDGGGLPEVRPNVSNADRFQHPEPAILTHVEQTPPWAAIYGKEFWRNPARDGSHNKQKVASTASAPAAVNLADVIERVSHALEMRTNGSAGVQA